MKESNELNDSNLDAIFEMILNNIKLERNRRKMSQQEIANILSISKSAYNLIENGKQKLTLFEFMKICQILDINLDFWNKKQLDFQNSNIENLNITKLIDANYLLADSNKTFSNSLDRLITINEKNSELIIKLCNK